MNYSVEMFGSFTAVRILFTVELAWFLGATFIIAFLRVGSLFICFMGHVESCIIRATYRGVILLFTLHSVWTTALVWGAVMLHPIGA